MLGVSLASLAQEQSATIAASGDSAASTPSTSTVSTESESWINLQGSDLHLGKPPPITFHGFVSQGFLASEDYNYLAPNTTEGSFQFFEAGVNASCSPFPNTRISMQGFSYDMGESGEYDPVLDYAQAEYTFNDVIGARAGRVRRPEGIYNSIQDLDLARSWVLLPQGMYNARWRDGIELPGRYHEGIRL